MQVVLEVQCGHRVVGEGQLFMEKVDESDEDSEQSSAVVRTIQETSSWEGPRDHSEKRSLGLLLTIGISYQKDLGTNGKPGTWELHDQEMEGIGGMQASLWELGVTRLCSHWVWDSAYANFIK